jgi:hypothetical protein
MTRCRTGWGSWRSPEKLLVIALQLVEENSTRKAAGTQCCVIILQFCIMVVLYKGLAADTRVEMVAVKP